MPRGISVLSSEHSILEVSTDGGGTWQSVPGVIDYVESGSEVPTRDVVPLGDAVQKRAGRPRVPAIACQMFYLPQTPLAATLRAAKDDRTILNWRFTTQRQELFSSGTGSTGAKAAIATTGLVTLTAGTGVGARAAPDLDNEAFGIGMAFVIAGTRYVVTGFNTNDMAMVSPVPSASIAASEFTIEIPSVRRGPFAGFVVNIDEWNLAAESELQTTLMIQPVATPPAAALAA